MAKVRLRTEGTDAAYVEEKLGRELYSQLGAMPRIAEFRDAAVERAAVLYADATARSTPEPEITGLGLLVLQRTLLACEDFGALVYSLADEPHWLRFTSYRPDDLDEMFAMLRDRRADVRDLWAMPSDAAIAEEPGWTDLECRASRRLREVTAAALEEQVDMVSDFWIGHRRSIKNVMHGFSLVPACFLLDPPGAGVLSKQVDLDQERPFAASLVSELNDRERLVETTTYTLDLTGAGIAEVRWIASTACGLLARLADARRFAVQSHHGYVLGDEFADRLGADDRGALTLRIYSRDG